ncbi:hypothetical protein AVEN_201409-1 [Araneus ventricosus]|uniref:DUF4817 domain-containing protein n=1 Tax=Araneus ventricosus TaxID=182803 RepID=A0A4Y2FFW9_ARAVE|nr:hypothetical protein AVEN_153215-1 [Araneus ventricosus]GBM40423.1 hypothetical protein AVEN_201409-1 [Araneus ventricosus]
MEFICIYGKCETSFALQSIPISIILWIKRRRILHEHELLFCTSRRRCKKSDTDKIVLPEPAEFLCSCRRIPSYEAAQYLRKMIQKFETNGQLAILPGRGRKQIPSSSVEDMATAVFEASSQSSHGQNAVPCPVPAAIMTTEPVEWTWDSVTGQRYRDMMRDFVILQLQQLQQRGCLQGIIFMQDGAPPHIDHLVKQLLRQHFTDARVIRRHFPTA